MAGLCQAKRLLDVGITDFVVLEGSPSIGGTWNFSKYPGLACDVTSHFYTFSFFLNPWYLKKICILLCFSRFGLNCFTGGSSSSARGRRSWTTLTPWPRSSTSTSTLNVPLVLFPAKSGKKYYFSQAHPFQHRGPFLPLGRVRRRVDRQDQVWQGLPRQHPHPGAGGLQEDQGARVQGEEEGICFHLLQMELLCRHGGGGAKYL